MKKAFLKTLPAAINSIDEAKAFLKIIFDNGAMYHPNDDATQLIGDPYTKEEGEMLNRLMAQAQQWDWHIFDPSGWLLWLDFRRDHDLDKYEMQTGYKVREATESEIEEQGGDYGQPDKYIMIERTENEAIMLAHHDDKFILCCDCETYSGHSLQSIDVDILESFVSCFGEDMRAITPMVLTHDEIKDFIKTNEGLPADIIKNLQALKVGDYMVINLGAHGSTYIEKK